MSDTNSGSPSNNPRPTSSPGRILAIVLPVAVVGLIAYWWSQSLESKARGDIAPSIMGRMFTAEPMPMGGMAFPDADNDMVADTPSDPAKQINPETLVFSYVATEEGGPPEEAWKELAAALKAKTGKEVKIAHY